ncbi:MAG: VPLPA-CTERM-specific exosortase XrtD [Deltaproteobacteria bacterium]|nr:VPLPA-CTERM-specific exosortase XrtD [Deltaproteobacteria bacterium]
MSHNKQNSNWWLPGVVLLGCLLGAYWGILQGLVHQWLSNDDYSHGLLIVPIAGWLVWRKREELGQAAVRSDWRGLLLLLAAVGIYVVGELGAELFTTRLSMLVFVLGLTWMLYGAEVLKILRFPLAYLFVMLPLPGFIYRNITFPLQLHSSTWSVDLLHTLGVSAYREGNIIDLGFAQFQVAEACNGLRFILPLFAFGLLMAYLGQKSFWKGALLILATIPIAMLANVLRISGTGVAAMLVGTRAAEGFFHSFSGWLIFIVCCGLFLLLDFLLRFAPGHPKAGQKKQAAATSNPGAVVSWPAVLCAAAVVLATPPMVDYLGQVPPVPLQKPLKNFPLILAGWHGTRSTMESKIWKQVGGQDYVLIDYYREKEDPVNLYVAYYEYQRKGGDFVHSPRLCLPGAGWYVAENRARRIVAPPDSKGGWPALNINDLVISKEDQKELVYFWYQGRGRNFTNEFAAKFYMVWDGLWRRRTDGALVRLITPIGPERTEEQARQMLDSFALKTAAVLEQYLPK